MNLLSLIIIFLALLICGAIAFIAWELTADGKRKADSKRGANGTPSEQNRD
ncbi:hypothetical protein [Woeseia oceani]|uniref:hypothetical protein n=1 Tax=Woeseia oceani TaxID=1548547 RepID=UPI0012E9F253|nr:hypothetical protein [Woeseia oceani]